MAWQAGETIGSYVIEDVLGSGGMATVYRARHSRLAREVALKLLHQAFITDDNFIARFEREAQIVAQLDHPNIVPVYDFDDIEGQPYIAMKYIEGRTLKDSFTQAAPTLDEIVTIVDAVAAALTYAHSQGVLHRDVKPSNVIIDNDGTPYLTDFGLARAAQSGESTLSAGMIIGTPNYVAPEQASDDADVSEHSDVYSFGVMLYEMVVGRVPFTGKTPYATIHKHIYEQPPLPSEVNPEVPTQVEMVLLKALEKDPADRYQTPGELAEAFKKAVQASGLTELSPDRSSVLVTRQLPPIDSTPRIPNAPSSKPKRATVPSPVTSNDQSSLLLLQGEEGWASLPQDEIIAKRIEARRGRSVGLFSHLVPFIGVNVMIFASSGTLIPFFGWGAGFASHAMTTWRLGKRSTDRLYRDFDKRMTHDYGTDWGSGVSRDTVQNEWRKQLKQFEARTGLYTHAVVYLLINLMLWYIWAGDFGFPWPLFPMMGWGIGLVAHTAGVFMGKRMTKRDRASIEAELDMMRGLGSSAQIKRKNVEMEAAPERDPGAIRLTDDGELTNSMVEEFEDEQRRARN
ncbi:MAG: protein kinase [Chloroflexota bacterium]